MTESEVRARIVEATLREAQQLILETCPHCKANGGLNPVPQFEPSDNPHVLRFDWVGYQKDGRTDKWRSSETGFYVERLDVGWYHGDNPQENPCAAAWIINKYRVLPKLEPQWIAVNPDAYPDPYGKSYKAGE